ncbi:hypothetical protein [Achromobacter aloeverae]
MSATPSPQQACAAPGARHGHVSWLLASAWQRVGVALVVCAGLWALTGWAMGWW